MKYRISVLRFNCSDLEQPRETSGKYYMENASSGNIEMRRFPCGISLMFPEETLKSDIKSLKSNTPLKSNMESKMVCTIYSKTSVSKKV